MIAEESMDILVALKQEESKLEQQLRGIKVAILALNGSHTEPSRALIGPYRRWGGARRRRCNVGAVASVTAELKTVPVNA
jgi:hypothetical protein